MQAIIETVFDAVYLISVITIGILMIARSRQNRQFKWNSSNKNLLTISIITTISESRQS